MDLHVAGALELLENQIIHPALSLDEGRGENGEAASFLDVAGGSEELSRPGERLRIDASAHDASLVWLQIIVAARHAGDRIEQDDDIFSQFHEALGPFRRRPRRPARAG